MESIEEGANTVGMITERGPCRLGFYSLGMRLIFSDLELGNGWFDFNNTSIRHGYMGSYRRIYRESFGRDLPLLKLGKAFAMGFLRLMSVEDLEAERNRFLALELEPGSVMDCYEQGRNEIEKAKSLFGIRRALRRAKRSLRSLPVDKNRETVKVMVTGEVYCVIDPFANANVEARLARLGAEPIRVLWQTSYLRYAMHLDLLQRHNKRKASRAARAYLPEQLGGDCNSNIGHALMAHQLGYDGMVHLKPFGCMVEFVAENLLRVVEKDTGFPILCLTLDDLAAEERINVRLEAFVENLFQRKRARSRNS
jgi:predicted nucleotide-binding protein (sugar kinase/HSP70/actin superfamily)